MAKKADTEPARRPGTKPREKPQQIADELRQLIIIGALDEGDSLGHEPDLIERFGVSRPSLREALRILEAEGLISVIRGVQGGVVVHRPDQRLTARTAAIVLQSRNVPLADVFEARTIIEPAAVRLVASGRNRRACAKKLRALIDDEEEAIDDPEAFGTANACFHEELVAMAGNQTLTIVAEMLNEVVARAVTIVSQADSEGGSTATRRRGVRSQERLAELIEAGEVDEAEAHWRTHMGIVGRVMLGQRAKTVIDLLDHL
jgi:DNA-binding FadR family transcriptional regulator